MSVLIEIELDGKNISVNHARPGISAFILRAARSIDQLCRRDSNGEVVAWGPRIEADCVQTSFWIEEDHVSQLGVK